MSFFMVAFDTRVDLRVALADACGMVGRATASNWTDTEPLATAFRRLPTTGGGSKSMSIGSMSPMAFALVVEYTLRFLDADGTGDLGSLIATSRARRPVNNMICFSI